MTTKLTNVLNLMIANEDRTAEPNENITLEKFVHDSCPMTDWDYRGTSMYYIWDRYMTDAMNAFNRADKAVRDAETWTAYWNALHSYGCFAAAFTAVDEDDIDVAQAAAIEAYCETVALMRTKYPHLDTAYSTRN